MAGPTLWNSLPNYIRMAPTLSVFKSSLKTFFFSLWLLIHCNLCVVSASCFYFVCIVLCTVYHQYCIKFIFLCQCLCAILSLTALFDFWLYEKQHGNKLVHEYCVPLCFSCSILHVVFFHSFSFSCGLVASGFKCSLFLYLK